MTTVTWPFVCLLAAVCAGVVVFLVTEHRARRRELAQRRIAAANLAGAVESKAAELEEALQAKVDAEKDRARMEVRLANDDKLRLIGQLTGGVAHDFNNLLTVIQLASELLADELPPKSKKLANDIQIAADAGKTITASLLAYARQQVLQPVEVELRQFFKANHAIFSRAGKDVARVDIEMPRRGVYIKVDPGQLASAMMNLILNAKEASKANTSVRVSTRQLDNQVDIVVSDLGVGMSAAEIRHAVEPFYTTKAPSEGAGLGLAQVEGFIKQSGGELFIDSKPTQGTQITLRFDMCAEDNVHGNSQPVKLQAHDQEKILFVEDDEQVRALGTLVLENAGYKVVTANNGEEALKWLESNGFALDLLVSDLMMPGCVNGDELIHECSQRKPHVPTLLVTGYADDVSVESPILLKPFTTSALLKTVRELLAAQQLHRSHVLQHH